MENTIASLLTPSNIMFTLGIFGTLFTIWGRITKPQATSEMNDALQAQRDKIFGELYEKRFTEIQVQFEKLSTLNLNHVHTLDTKIDGVISSQNQTNIQLSALDATIKLLVQMPKTTTNVIQNPLPPAA